MSQRTNVAIALIGLLLLPMTSAQDPSVTNAPRDCTNNGIIVQASGGPSTINCEGECTNNGVVVQASTSTAYTCDGGCTNNGVIVWGPRTDGHSNGCGDGPYQEIGGACIGDACVLPHLCDPRICDPRIVEEVIDILTEQDLRLAMDTPLTHVCHVDKGTQPPHVTCGDYAQCAILENPGCWSVRLGCTLARNQTRVPEVLDRYGVHCETWDSFSSLPFA